MKTHYQQENLTVDREMGRLEGRLDALEQRQKDHEKRVEDDLKEIRAAQKNHQDSLDNIEGILLQATGAIKLVSLIVAVATAFGGFVTWALGLWNFGNGGGS